MGPQFHSSFSYVSEGENKNPLVIKNKGGIRGKEGELPFTACVVMLRALCQEG